MKILSITRILCMVAVMCMALLVAGCDNNSNSQGDTASEKKIETETTKPEEKPAAKDMEIKVYFPDENATKLIVEKRTISLKQGEDKYALVLDELLKGPKDKSLVRVFPQNAKVKSVKVENGTATVDFNKALKSEFKGGSTGEELLVESLVNTLTDFSEVKRVKILIEGKSIESLSGHMDLSTTLERSK